MAKINFRVPYRGSTIFNTNDLKHFIIGGIAKEFDTLAQCVKHIDNMYKALVAETPVTIKFGYGFLFGTITSIGKDGDIYVRLEDKSNSRYQDSELFVYDKKHRKLNYEIRALQKKRDAYNDKIDMQIEDIQNSVMQRIDLSTLLKEVKE